MTNLSRCSCVLFVVAIAAAAFAPPAIADDLHVPGQYATIQAAINASVEGDTIIVAPGTYNEAIDMAGRRVTLRSSDGPAATTLDGAGLGVSIVTADGGESYLTVIEGFTFQNGAGTRTANCITSNGWVGGAILAQNCRMTIRDCIFQNNGISLGFEMTAGGAIYARNAGLRINDSTFLDNGGFGDTGDGIHSGGAIFACDDSNLQIENTIFDGNGPAGHGGAVYSDYGDFAITHSTFTHNDGSHGGGVNGYGEAGDTLVVSDCHFEANVSSHGGGLRLSCGDVASVERCTFVQNRASFGAGINVDVFSNGVATISDVDVTDNDAGFAGGIFGSAFDNAVLTITGAIVSDNVASAACCATGIYWTECFVDGSTNGRYWGGGADLRTFYGGQIGVYNSLFANNTATRGGGLHAAACGGGVIDIASCTIVDNGPTGLHLRNGGAASVGGAAGAVHAANLVVARNPNSVEITLRDTTAEPDITYSDIVGGHPGTGNIDADPLFANAAGGDYRLAGGSPCIDAGDNSALPVSIVEDLAGGARHVDDPATLDTGVGTPPLIDMGAFEFQATGGCPADLDGDGVVGVGDLALLLSNFGGAGGPAQGDLDGDGIVSLTDLTTLIAAFGLPCG